MSGYLYRDHGDLWDIGWDVVRATGSSLTLDALGRDAPLRFRRTIDVRPNGVDVAYTVTSTADHNVPVLWAWHPQFAADPDTRLVVDDLSTVVDAFDPDAHEASWTGSFSMPKPGAFRKLWSGRDERPSCALLHRGDGRTLTVTWTGDAVRWVGLWLDHAAYSNECVVAIEPSTGWFDDASRALARDSILQLPPGGRASWALRIGLTRESHQAVTRT